MTHVAPLVRDNTIVFCAGKKRSGKSTLLYEYFVTGAPRTISLDFTGDTKERNPNAIEVVGFQELVTKLRELIAANVQTWHIVAVFDIYNAKELPQLYRLLCPPYRPGQVTLARALGGIALECGECELIFPNGGAHPEALNMIHRGRHNLLSLFMATRRPQDCSRLCTSQADFVISFAMHEPNELRYFGKMSQTYANVLPHLPPFTSAWYEPDTGLIEIRSKEGETIKQLSARSTREREELFKSD